MSATEGTEWSLYGQKHFGPTLVLLRLMTAGELRAYGPCSCPSGDHADWHKEHKALARRCCPFPLARKQIEARLTGKNNTNSRALECVRTGGAA